jgi:hypothetical protein
MVLLNRVLQAAPFVKRFTQPPATIQVAEHGFGQYVYGFHILGPLELLLATAKVLECVFKPE